MGWASGADIADNVWDIIKSYIPEHKKVDVASDLIDEFESRDCDTMQETQLWDIAMMRCPASMAENEEDWEAFERHERENDCEICDNRIWIRRNEFHPD